MKKIVYILFILTLIGFTDELIAQTASFGGTLTTNNNEGDIRVGGDTLTITLVSETWVDTLGEDNIVTTAFLNSIVGDGGGDWATVAAELSYLNVVRASATVVKIGFPAVANYDIYADELISSALPGSALSSGNPLIVFPNLTITHDPVTAVLDGTILGATESAVRSSDHNITLTLTNDAWHPDMGLVAGTTITNALLAGITGTTWDSKITTLDYNDVTVDGTGYILTITIPDTKAADYYLGGDETVLVTIPDGSFANTSGDPDVIPVPSGFQLLDEDPDISVSGTIFDGVEDGEEDIRSNEPTIILTLTGDKWLSDIASNLTSAEYLFNSINGSFEWNTEVRDILGIDDIDLVGQTVTITLPPGLAYDIYTDETVTINIDAAALQYTTAGSVAASSTLTITHDPLTAVMEGSVLLSKNESAFNAGGDSIVLKMRNDIWASTIGQDNSLTDSLLSGIAGNQSWDQIPLDYTDVYRRNDSTVTIIIPASPDYFIGSSETVTINIPDNVSANSSDAIVPSPNSFAINNESVSFSLSGDLVTGIAETEADIRAGGKTLIITVNGDVWVPQIEYVIGTADLLFDEISGSTSWNTNLVGYTLANIDLIDPSIIELSFPAAGSYNIDVTDNISINIVADILKTTTGGPFLINSAFSIEPLPVSITTSGNIQAGIYNKEDSIRAGGGEIIFTLAEDDWEPLLGTNNILTANLINGISGVPGSDWETKVKPAILGGDQGATNVNVVGNVLTVTIPAVSTYNILSTDVLSCEIPASCLVNKTSGTVTSAPAISIIPAPAEVFINDPGLDELTVDGSVLTLTLKDETFKDAGLVASNFVSSKSPAITVSSVLYLSPTSAEITLSLDEDFDATINDFSIAVNAVELTAGATLNSNNISISAQLEPEITAVNIDNSTYKIDDVVIAEITVVDDNSAVYEYVSGTIAGRSLDSLKRQSNTLYYGYFTVNAGGGDFSATDNIPVVGLQLNNLPLIGEVYDGIVSSSTIIDASKPEVNYMQVSGNSKKVGDEIEIIVSADGNSYDVIAPTSVNLVTIGPNLSFQNLGNGVYILKYKISENDFDVATGALTAQITFEDQAGNQSDTYSVLSTNSISIDANSPLISKISVTNGIYTVDDVVEIVVRTDGDNYNFDLSTEVNGVPYYSSALNGSSSGNKEYTLYYTIKSSDAEVEPGLLDVKVRMTDLAGNISTLYQTVNPNSLAIYTQKPTANVAGSIEICEDDSALIVVNLSGRFPLTIYSYDGSTTKMHDGIVTSPYKFYVNPTESADYRIDSVLDFNGIKNTGTGEVEVVVNQKTDVNFINLNSSFSLEDDPVVLEANEMGGVFSGPGVISTGGIFNPGIADTTNSPHTLYYKYTNTEGCISYDSSVVFVLGAQGDIFIPKTVYCDYDVGFTVQASNTAGSTGSFRLLNSSQEPISGLVDNLNNTAIVTPTSLDAGVYTVEYKYDDGGASLILRDIFTIETVQVPRIDNLATTIFCQNDAAIELTGTPETAVFSGAPGVSGNLIDGFEFNPETANLGKNTVVFTNTTVNGCVSSVNETLTVNFVPDVQFLESDVCITSDETILFENLTEYKDSVSEWSWNFGDINSGELNISSAVDGYHKYTKPGNRTILLVATTGPGCTNSYSRTVDFGDKPHGTFVWTNECFIDGDSILFISNVESENELTNFNWVFYNSDTDSTVFTGADIDQLYYTFNGGIDDYDIKLNVVTSIGCKNEINRTIVLKPTIRVSDEGYYLEDFETDNGRWSTNHRVVVEGENAGYPMNYNSWVYDSTDFSTHINKNSNAWYINVPEDTIVKEQSWVISPCYNLRDVEKPMISLDIFRNMDENEGVVLQYSTTNGISWKNLGTLNQGINWFNDFEITDKPADQEIGWSGAQSGDEWIKAIRYIDELKDAPNVRFRLYYGTERRKYFEGRGFAFDNFKISSRTRMVLMENFTNGSNAGIVNSDKDVNTLYSNNFGDVVKLEYHTDIGGPDPFNASNVFVPATRSLFYGVNSLPELIIDGGNNGLLTYTTAAQIGALDSSVIALQSLLEPIFEIGLDVDYGQDLLTANVQLKALKALGEAERILQVVVYEKVINLDVPTGNGQVEFRNVVRDMIPNAAGTAYFNAWEEGESVSEQFRWSYDDVYDPEMLRVAVFVQNDNTKEIYQAATDYKTHWLTGINEGLPESVEIGLYPNPAGEFVYLRMSSAYNEDFKLEVFDNMGRVIEQREWTSGSQLERIDLDQYIQGFYFIRLRDSKGQIRAIKKLAVVK